MMGFSKKTALNPSEPYLEIVGFCGPNHGPRGGKNNLGMKKK